MDPISVHVMLANKKKNLKSQTFDEEGVTLNPTLVLGMPLDDKVIEVQCGTAHSMAVT
jgi:hypothetical protein